MFPLYVVAAVIAVSLAIVFTLIPVCLHLWMRVHLWLRPALRPVIAGEVVVVTGASSGIGRHAALDLNRRGFTVFAGIRKASDGDSLKASAVYPENLRPLRLDVANPTELANALDIVADECKKNGLHGGLSALFNNAGVADDGIPMADKETTLIKGTPISSFRFIFEVNVFGLIQCTQAFLPLLKKAGGTVINNSSVDGALAFPCAGAYSSSKWAVEGFSDCLRREMLLDPAGKQVRVVVMQPGCINTKIHNKVLGIEAAAELLRKVDNPKLSSAERRVHAGQTDALKASVSPKETTNVLVEAILSATPRARYVINPFPFQELFYILPDSVVDSMLIQAIKNQPEEPRTSVKELAAILEQAE